MPASRKVECGATTRIGASFLDAWRPFTISLMPPTWYVPLPSEQIIGFNFLSYGQQVSQFSSTNKELTATFIERCMLSATNSMTVVGNIYMIVLSPSHTFSAIISLNIIN